MRTRIALAVLFVCCVMLSSPFQPAAASSAASESVQVGKQAPPFAAPLVGGGRFDLRTAQKGDGIVLLNFWGLRCAACIQEIPYLVEIHKKYSGRVRVLGINVDGVDAAFLKAEMEKIGIAVPYEVAPDPDFTVVDLYKMPAAPYTVLIDANGTIRYLHEDYKPGDEKEIDALIRKILGEGNPKGN